jgi:segregation and condensation protein A
VTYEVDTPVFAGPFDLLLHLILQDEVDLYEISLGGIIDAYLQELTRMGDVDLGVATEFLLIASTLVELKSRRLLPDTAGYDLEDELALWEERDLLLARLLECKTFKDASRSLENLAYDASFSYPRTAGMEEQFLGLVPDLLTGITAVDLAEAYCRVTAPKPQVDFFHVTPVKLTVAETVTRLVEEISKQKKTTLRELTSSAVDRIEVVVHFLAILEMYKQGIVELTQFTTFGSLTIEWVGFAEAGGHSVIDIYEG